MRIVRSFEGKDTVFETTKRRVTIGRARADLDVDLDLSPDKTVSRPHAAIVVDDGRFFIEDLGSSRGTLVNGEDVKGMGRRRLSPGDSIQLGDTTLVLEGTPE